MEHSFGIGNEVCFSYSSFTSDTKKHHVRLGNIGQNRLRCVLMMLLILNIFKCLCITMIYNKDLTIVHGVYRPST